MLEAGAPLPYVMDQVGHLDSKTTLEIYAQVQKRVSRTKVHLAFGERHRCTFHSDGRSPERESVLTRVRLARAPAGRSPGRR
jgi:hypothetical protein